MQTPSLLKKEASKLSVTTSGKTTTNPLQLKAIVEEDNALQMKQNPLQLQSASEDEELLQKKENPLQLKQRSDTPLQLQGEETVAPQLQKNNTGLPDNLKAGVEALSGYSMDDVKVHYNSHKPAQLQALAYAQGTSIHIAPGQEQHLPHEAWHVVQQKQGRVQPIMQLKQGITINDDRDLESEADVMGNKAVQMKTEQHKILPTADPVNHADSVSGLSVSPQLRAVIQGKWKCNECGKEGQGKPKTKCPDCKSSDINEVNEGRLPFGTWWENLSNDGREALLREHGSHEANGGLVTKKNQGGGAKGNQHSNGVARAKEQIREKYESGEYD